VEAQHRVTTMALAGGRPADQAVLEDLLETAKPPRADATDGLHFLLATPFRYPTRRGGSRFRRAFEPGVFYAGEDRATACAEAGYWRLRFWRDSAGLAGRPASVELTLFQFHARTDAALDLSAPPLDRDRAHWTRGDDYTATQALAAAARAAGVALIRYQSARHPPGHCVALLTPAPFRAEPRPFRGMQQTWSLHLQPPDRVTWQRHLATQGWSFRFADLAAAHATDRD